MDVDKARVMTMNGKLIVVVPRIPATELAARTSEAVRATWVHAAWSRWDFYRDTRGSIIPGQGLTFEAVLWSAGEHRNVSADEIRAFFAKHGAPGHVGAALQWLRQQGVGLTGCFATVPAGNGDCFWERGDGKPRSLCYRTSSQPARRQLDLDWVTDPDGYDEGWTLLGFKPVAV